MSSIFRAVRNLARGCTFRHWFLLPAELTISGR
ncbi:MAG: hypothetical protein JWO63_3383 [Frankiales bacterium]|nr:hypothetical protein [Frankiales bacterium]